MNHTKNNSVTPEWKNLKCPTCKRTNIGWQSNCLFCQAELIVASHSDSSCNGCGATIKNGQKFCLQCGKKVENPSELPSCLDCGAQITSDLNFCLQCGKKL